MPYNFDWLDSDLNIAAVRLFDPFRKSDVHALEADFVSLIEGGDPLFLMVDIREVNPLKAFSTLGQTDGLSLRTVSKEQAEASKLAVVGGGATVKMLIQMVENSEQKDQVRIFDHEDRAYAWLTEEARKQKPARTAQDDIWTE